MADSKEMVREDPRAQIEDGSKWKAIGKQKEELGKALKNTITGNNTGKDGKILEMRREIKEICDE